MRLTTRLKATAFLACSLVFLGSLPGSPFLHDARAASDVSPPPLILSPNLADPWLRQLSSNRAKPSREFRPRRQGYAQDKPHRTLIQRIFSPSEQTYTVERRRRGPTTYRPLETSVRPAPSPVTRSSRKSSQARGIAPQYLPTVVAYHGTHEPGTIVIDTSNRYLYLVQDDGTARRYGVGVGRPGFSWAGEHHITRKAEWPTWTPPEEMRRRQPGLPTQMAGGPNNPLGARALYLGSTLYRIHGSNQPWTIGHAVSSGCIRMRNQDVIDLYNRVSVGTEVFVM